MTPTEIKKLVRIAQENIPELENRPDLEARQSDELDFFETSVWSLKDALIAAYELGKAAGREEAPRVGGHLPTVKGYTPVCPRGYDDCVWDPAYIKHRDPEWYETLYGDLTPEEAAHIRGGCFDRFKDDPEEKYYCYDDENK